VPSLTRKQASARLSHSLMCSPSRRSIKRILHCLVSWAGQSFFAASSKLLGVAEGAHRELNGVDLILSNTGGIVYGPEHLRHRHHTRAAACRLQQLIRRQIAANPT
jgi:hypothetical protein